VERPAGAGIFESGVRRAVCERAIEPRPCGDEREHRRRGDRLRFQMVGPGNERNHRLAHPDAVEADRHRLREKENDGDRRAEAETERARNEVKVSAALHLEIRRDRRELFCARSTDCLRPIAAVRSIIKSN